MLFRSPADLQPFPDFGAATGIDAETNTELVMQFGEDSAQSLANLVQQHGSELDSYFRSAQIGFQSIRSNLPLLSVIQGSLRKIGLIGG